MTKFSGQLFTDLMSEHQSALEQARLPVAACGTAMPRVDRDGDPADPAAVRPAR
jgi:hypothetical protein